MLDIDEIDLFIQTTKQNHTDRYETILGNVHKSRMTAFTINDQDLRVLKDQVVIVTGASSGIGLATVKLLLEQGTYIIAGDLNQSPIEHERLVFVRTNVASWTDLSNMFKLAKSKHGRIDHVFANAGISGRTTYLDEKFDENGDLLEPNHTVFDINLKGVVNTSALAIHYLRKQDDGGSVVLTASASSFQKFRGVDYTVAKHGVLGLMRGLVAILDSGIPIRVNAVAPSWTRTGLVPDGLLEKIAGVSSQSPDVPAKSVAILMADIKRNGQLIYSVDGRYSEAEEVLSRAAKEIVGDMNEDIVMAKLLRKMSGFGVTESSYRGLSDKSTS